MRGLRATHHEGESVVAPGADGETPSAPAEAEASPRQAPPGPSPLPRFVIAIGSRRSLALQPTTAPACTTDADALVDDALDVNKAALWPERFKLCREQDWSIIRGPGDRRSV